MTNATAPALASRNWKDLYTAALFESDNGRLPARIADAERAIIDRARELFSTGCDTIEEDQALDDALYGLRALQSCLQMRVAAQSRNTPLPAPFRVSTSINLTFHSGLE